MSSNNAILLKRTPRILLLHCVLLLVIGESESRAEEAPTLHYFHICVDGNPCSTGLGSRCRGVLGAECEMCALQSPQKHCVVQWNDACFEWTNPTASDCGTRYLGTCEWIPGVKPGYCVDPLIVGLCERSDCF